MAAEFSERDMLRIAKMTQKWLGLMSTEFTTELKQICLEKLSQTKVGELSVENNRLQDELDAMGNRVRQLEKENQALKEEQALKTTQKNDTIRRVYRVLDSMGSKIVKKRVVTDPVVKKHKKAK